MRKEYIELKMIHTIGAELENGKIGELHFSGSDLGELPPSPDNISYNYDNRHKRVDLDLSEMVNSCPFRKVCCDSNKCYLKNNNWKMCKGVFIDKIIVDNEQDQIRSI